MLTNDSRKGFTLVEVLIGAVILGVIAGGFFSSLLHAKQMLNSEENQHRAYFYAQKAMRQLSDQWKNNSSDFPADSPSVSEPAQTASSVDPYGNEDDGSGVFTRDIFVFSDSVPGDAASGSKRKLVKVKVTWNEESGNAQRSVDGKTYEVATLLHRP